MGGFTFYDKTKTLGIPRLPRIDTKGTQRHMRPLMPTSPPRARPHTPFALENGLCRRFQDHDVVLWFGDLNYRIEASIAALEVLGHAVSGRLRFLAANDQLNGAREAGAVFEGFHEGKEGGSRRLGNKELRVVDTRFLGVRRFTLRRDGILYIHIYEGISWWLCLVGTMAKTTSSPLPGLVGQRQGARLLSGSGFGISRAH